MSQEELRAEVQRVLQSSHFHRTPKLQRFLALVCDYYFQDRSREINEFLIATEAFGKGPDFDPSQDSLVRVQAREVRRRLREYYQNEGKGNPLVLDIPLGHYVPEFTVTPQAPSPRFGRPLRAAGIMLGATVLVCIAILFLADRERRQLLGASAFASEHTGRLSSPLLGELWNRFLNSGVPTLLVLSNPDVGDCSPSQPATPGEKPRMVAADGSPCPDEFTGMGEAVALHLITNLFQSAKQTLIVKQSRMVNADDVKRFNLILLGGKDVNAWTRRLGKDVGIEASDLTGSRRDPEIARYFTTVFDPATDALIQDHAIIAVRKDATTGNWLMFLYGKHSQGTQAAAEAAAGERFLSQLKWPPGTRPFPESFRLLVRVTVSDGIPQEPIPVSALAP